MTKRDIARAIHEAEPSISINQAVGLVEVIFETIKERLEAGEKVMITNFGTFDVADRASRRGINPATGEALIIDAHRAVTFRPSPALSEVVDGTIAP